MTMEVSEKEVEYISNQIETRAITYHTVCRELKLSPARSKRLLAEYYLANKKSLCATFVASGKKDGISVLSRFETEQDLEENVATFDHITTVHVYSIQLEKNSITNVEVALEELLHLTKLDSVTELHKLGLIKGPTVERLNSPIKQTLSSSRKDNATTKSDLARHSQHNAVAESKNPAMVYQSRKSAPKPSLMSGYISRKSENPKVREHVVEQPKKTYQYNSRKSEQTEPKERVVVSHADDEEEANDRKPEVVQPTGVTDLNNLFLDDDFTDEEGDVKGNDVAEEETQPIAVEGEEELAAAPAVSAPTVPEDSILRSFTSSSSSKNSFNAETPPAPLPPKETTVDQDGYFTLYKRSEPESVKAPLKKPKLETTKTTATKGDTKKKQASLMSFFGKR